MKRVPIYLESAPKRTFAGALEWPGWARSGKTEADALDALLAYGPRYAKVVGRGAGYDAPTDTSALQVVERLRGGATTEFGAPGEIPAADERELDREELARQVRLLQAAWKAFEAAGKRARGVELRKGPRGGGRDLPKMVEHVLEAELGYLAKLGARYRGAPDDTDELRRLAVATIRAVARDEPIPDPTAVKKRWPPRYFVRRSTWHILDHAWEIEDRARPAQGG
jgi:hypothetical protein